MGAKSNCDGPNDIALPATHAIPGRGQYNMQLNHTYVYLHQYGLSEIVNVTNLFQSAGISGVVISDTEINVPTSVDSDQTAQ